MRTFHIYTDASCKDTSMFPHGVKRTTKVGIVVVDSHIVDIYYKRREKFCNSNRAEAEAIRESVYYVQQKYNTNNIIVHSDSTNLSKYYGKLIKGIKILYVKGHCPNRRGLKYKFNCLADWISRNGINTWRNYYYKHLLK